MKKIIFSLSLLIASAVIFFACTKNGDQPAPESIHSPVVSKAPVPKNGSKMLNNVEIPAGTLEVKNADGSLTLVLPEGYLAVGVLANTGTAVGADTVAAGGTVTISCECLGTGKCYPVVAGGGVYSCATKAPDLCSACLLRTKTEPAGNRQLVEFTLKAIINTKAGAGFVKMASALPEEIHFNKLLLQVPAFKKQLDQFLQNRYTSKDVEVLSRVATTGTLPANYTLRAVTVMGQLMVVALNTDVAVNADPIVVTGADTTINGVTYSCKCTSGNAGCKLEVLAPGPPIVSCNPGACTVCEMKVVQPKKKEENLEFLK